MAVLVTSDIPGGTAERDAAIMEALGLKENPPSGARFRVAGSTEDGWRILSLWDSKDEFDAFIADRLTPVLDRLGGPRPIFEVWKVDSVMIIP